VGTATGLETEPDVELKEGLAADPAVKPGAALDNELDVGPLAGLEQAEPQLEIEAEADVEVELKLTPLVEGVIEPEFEAEAESMPTTFPEPTATPKCLSSSFASFADFSFDSGSPSTICCNNCFASVDFGSCFKNALASPNCPGAKAGESFSNLR
jgi:hypothetical protein